ncbi:MAG: hypothetical protein AAF245_01150 [Pseudomonadota bacterium]
MGRVLKYLVYLLLLGVVALVGYTLVADLPAPTERVVVPVTPVLE